jgi:hypothetical protein
MAQFFRRYSKDALIEVFLFLTLFVSYAYVFPRWADPNQNSRLDMAAAVVELGTFQIDTFVQNTVDYARVGDHYYSDKAPGAAFLGIPVYWGVKIFLDLPYLSNLTDKLSNNQAFQATLNPEGTGISDQKVRFAVAQVLITLVVSALPSAILGVLLFKCLKVFSEDIGPRLLISLAYGLLTPVLAYAGSFYGHQLSAMLLFWAFYLAFTQKELSKFSLLWIGFLLGYSIITEYPAALIAGAIALYVFFKLIKSRRPIDVFWLVPLGLSVLVLWMIYNNSIFGGPLHLGYSNSELWTSQHQTGFMSLSIPTWDAFLGITFGDYRGLFFFAPITLLFFPGIYLWWRSRKYLSEWLLVIFIVLAMFLFNCSSIMWWGGFAVGPRYLLPMIPFMALAWIFPLLRWKSNRFFMLGIIIVSLWSFIAVWGLTLAGRAFPSDTLYHPLLEYALPLWLSGNIARNVGTIFGLRGVSSLLPLLIIYLGLGIGLRLSTRNVHFVQKEEIAALAKDARTE